MNKKLVWIIIIFLLFVPFRLPIAVLFINLITYIANLAGDLSNTVLVANVILTKLAYDIVLAAVSVYSLEILSRNIKDRKAQESVYKTDEMAYWWTIVYAIFLFAYIIFDCVTTHTLYFELLKQ